MLSVSKMFTTLLSWIVLNSKQKKNALEDSVGVF